MNDTLSEKLIDLANHLSYASEAKEAARLRAQCSLEEWNLVRFEAKKIFHRRRMATSSQRRGQEYAANKDNHIDSSE